MPDEMEQIGASTLYRGDALSILPTLPDASVQLICVDPPYFRVKAEAWDRQWKDRIAYLNWLKQLAQEWQRVLTPNGSLYCFASPDMATSIECTLEETFHVLNRIQWLKQEGWHKKADPAALCSWLSAREEIIFAEQNDSQYGEAAQALHKQVYAPLGRYLQSERERAGVSRNDIDLALGNVSTANPHRGTSLCYRWEEGACLPPRDAYEHIRSYLNSRNGHADYLRREYEDLRREYEDLRREYEDLRREYEDLRRPFTVSANVPCTDVWSFQTVPASPGKHPAEKPLLLLRHIIEASSRPGDTVLDCMMGSGSTLDAARQCGRHAIGIEQDPHWYRHAVRRLSQLDLFATRPPLALMGKET